MTGLADADSTTDALARAERRYLERTPASARLHADAREVLPGGDTRSTLHHDPYPLFLARGQGSLVWDADGNEYLDFSNNHTALVHGNAFPPVAEAVRRELESGTCFGTPAPTQVRVAAQLVERVPTLDLVRFCNSGTEATLHATRAARAATGRRIVAKAEGAYHGSQDDVMVSTHPRPDQAGPADHPESVPRCPGLGRSALEDTVVFPFNDVDGAVARLREVGDDLAAVLVEPVMGSAGMIPITRDFFAALRETTAELGALLVVDEVITFRLSPGGGQQFFGVDADLSCYGKMIGGGFCLGALGGSSAVMDRFDPSRADALAHPGSMNANPVSLTAAAVTLEELDRAAIERLAALGADLRDRLTAVGHRHGVPLTVTGEGSLLALHFRDGPVRDFRDTWDEDRDLAHAVFLGLLNAGVLIDRRGAACLSTRTSEDDLAAFEDRLDAVLARLVGDGRPG